MNKRTFTVITPVHNKGPHIVRCIDSVLQQTFEDFEFILVDDASSDGSSEVMEDYDDPRIRVLRRESAGGGGYAARNLGISEATGEWIAFLDADDEWFENHLMDLKELAEEYPQASMLCSAWFIGTESEKLLNPFSKNRKGAQIFSPKEYLKLQADGWDVVHTDVVAIRRTELLSIGGFPEYSECCRRAGDGQTWLRVVLNGGWTAWTGRPGAIYYQDAVNMVTRSQSFNINQNGLVTYINSLVAQEKERVPHRKLLIHYRNRRVLSKLFQHVKTGEVSASHIGCALRYFSWDVRLFVLILGFICPPAGRFLFSLKEKNVRAV